MWEGKAVPAPVAAWELVWAAPAWAPECGSFENCHQTVEHTGCTYLHLPNENCPPCMRKAPAAKPAILAARMAFSSLLILVVLR